MAGQSCTITRREEDAAMPLALQELLKFVENFGYTVTAQAPSKKASVIDELLGAFADALPQDKTSTEYLKELRESGYGRY
jgi:monomeric isocitrate dehydrogenase